MPERLDRRGARRLGMLALWGKFPPLGDLLAAMGIGPEAAQSDVPLDRYALRHEERNVVPVLLNTQDPRERTEPGSGYFEQPDFTGCLLCNAISEGLRARPPRTFMGRGLQRMRNVLHDIRQGSTPTEANADGRSSLVLTTQQGIESVLRCGLCAPDAVEIDLTTRFAPGPPGTELGAPRVVFVMAGRRAEQRRALARTFPPVDGAARPGRRSGGTAAG